MDATAAESNSESESSGEKEQVEENTPPRPGPPPKKKAKRKSKYRAEWEKDYTWLESVREDEHKAHCMVCRRAFTVSHGGLNDVTKHASGECHKKNEKKKKSQGALRTFLIPQSTPEANMVC